MKDKEMAKKMAEYWIELGGDSEGFMWVISKIIEAIRDIEAGEKLQKEWRQEFGML